MNTSKPNTQSESKVPPVDPGLFTSIGGLQLVKSVRSASNGACVAVAQLQNGTVVVGDTKRPWQKVLKFTPAEWEAFVLGVKAGEFDLQAVHKTDSHGFAILQRAWSWLQRKNFLRV